MRKLYLINVKGERARCARGRSEQVKNKNKDLLIKLNNYNYERKKRRILE